MRQLNKLKTAIICLLVFALDLLMIKSGDYPTVINVLIKLSLATFVIILLLEIYEDYIEIKDQRKCSNHTSESASATDKKDGS
jgi:hypothetical protein